MGAYSAYLVSSSWPYSNAATFRNWASVVDGTFITFGWVRTADSGQIADWATATGTYSGNAVLQYSVFRMADSLQGSYPVFLKVEYGSNGGNNDGNSASIWITLGTGSDGSGNITGIVASRRQLYNGTAENTSMPCYFSGSTSRYCCILWPGNNQEYPYMLFSVERTKNASGADTGDGLLLLEQTYDGGPYSQYIPFSGTAPAGYAAWNCNIPTTVTPAISGAYKNTVAVYPIRCWTPGESGPSSNIFLFQKNDINVSVPPNVNTVQLTLFDGAVTGTYLPIYFATPVNVFGTSGVNRGTSGTSISILMRYE